MLANQWNLLTKYGDFKRRKLEICPTPSKNIFGYLVSLFFLTNVTNF
jgi:hypothetical protein